ncbi:O-linked N-acetylglucosamine transferase, SPINDLY family protein, partial [Endothiovibrio diazotrophicus]
HAYNSRWLDDALSRRLRPAFAGWRSIEPLSDEQAARLIHQQGIDLLLDLSGHTSRNRLPLFAWRAAPVQASWLGYSATTGMSEIDWYVTDGVRAPQGVDDHYSEGVWRLPHIRMSLAPPALAPAVTGPPALRSGAITFGSFQRLTKITGEVVAVWSEVLSRVPGSRLRLQCGALAEEAVREGLLTRFAAHGIGRERLLLLPAECREAYLEAHGEVDLILDTFPYPGGTTTCEALWMGVPTLTLAGATETSRNGASQLVCAGLGEWVADSREAYVAKALAFAGDLPGLQALRAGLRERVAHSPLFDQAGFARDLADALHAMVRRRWS